MFKMLGGYERIVHAKAQSPHGLSNDTGSWRHAMRFWGEGSYMRPRSTCEQHCASCARPCVR